jgi:hypothetical protein
MSEQHRRKELTSSTTLERKDAWPKHVAVVAGQGRGQRATSKIKSKNSGYHGL